MIYWTYFSLTAIALCALYLIFEPDYEDGVIGRFALAALIVACVSMIFSCQLETLPNAVHLVAWGVALFICRHVYRFRRFQKTGQGRWQIKGRPA